MVRVGWQQSGICRTPAQSVIRNASVQAQDVEQSHCGCRSRNSVVHLQLREQPLESVVQRVRIPLLLLFLFVEQASHQEPAGTSIHQLPATHIAALRCLHATWIPATDLRASLHATPCSILFTIVLYPLQHCRQQGSNRLTRPKTGHPCTKEPGWERAVQHGSAAWVLPEGFLGS